MGFGRGGRGEPRPPWVFKISAKKIVFLVPSGKKQISPLLPPWKNALVTPLAKAFRRPCLEY